MNKELLTGAVVVTFLLLAYGVEVVIDTWWPRLRDRYRCLVLIVAAALVVAIALRFVD